MCQEDSNHCAGDFQMSKNLHGPYPRGAYSLVEEIDMN